MTYQLFGGAMDKGSHTVQPARHQASVPGHETVNNQRAQPAAQRFPADERLESMQLMANRSPRVATQSALQQAMNQRSQPDGIDRSGPVVQGYFVVQPNNLSAEKHATFNTQILRQSNYASTYTTKEYRTTERATNPSVRATTTETNTGTQQNQNTNLPPFKVSENGELAVMNEGQPKNFYATTQQVDDSNQVLSQSGTDVRLKTQGHGIVVPEDPSQPGNGQTNRLKKVHAAQDVVDPNTQQITRQIAATFDAMNCDNFIRLVLGASANGSRMAVLVHNGDQNSEQEVRAEAGREPIVKIAHNMTQQRTPGPTRLRRAIQGQNLNNQQEQNAQTNYEQLGQQQMNTVSNKVGINDFAVPEVGEGLVIRSVMTQGMINQPQAQEPQIADNTGPQNKRNRRRLRDGYMATIQQLNQANQVLNGMRQNIAGNIQWMMRTWGEHYAGVVARDGSDYVTMENYNRNTEIRWEYERIFNNLFANFQDFRNLVSASVDQLNSAPSPNVIQQLVQLAQQGAGQLSQQYQQALQQATDSFQDGIRLSQQTGQGNYFFAMYGPGAQSFHSAYKGLASNSMTLRLRETTGPVQAEAQTAVQNLGARIQQWGQIVNANNVGGLTPALQQLVQTATNTHQQAQQSYNQAQNRGQYAAVDRVATQAQIDLRTGLNNALRNGYQTITGNPLGGMAFNSTDYNQQITQFLGTYSWYQKMGQRYNRSVQYQALTNAFSLINF